MKKQFVAIVLGALPLLAPAADNAAEAFFTKKNPALTPQEKNAIAIAKKWQANGADAAGMKPVAGPGGVVRFIFGVQQIRIVCAVLQVCDVELQPGEQVNNLNQGDPRFTVEPAVSGVGAGEVQHLIIKPLDVGLDTTLIVTTNRRTYHMKLRSHRTQYMPRVGFTYPEDAAAKWDAIRTREVREKAEQTIPQTKEVLSDLCFKYDVRGSARWKPVRVYNDGVRTVIQMPAAMTQTEAPALLVVRKEGGLFTEDDTVQVNYRVHGDRYIVDTVFDKAVMIAGVGRGQDRVTITKEK
ncbi:P-type conjugative transfer protein TrbG [Massilia glaciei]|uniref:P-type conjugative transfer protein TrbG n=1 Tax=Massilia glaciei TaxID=1524097 RepID=A0A2U2I6P2_9BURK|nr:P-type conjugative transfer protein TrbG [Massilia glaciei]PWF55365.1 P-type conjugative transfer protein TrbG [Massilia glaciei]